MNTSGPITRECTGSTIPDFDLWLEILLMVRRPGEKLGCKKIASVIGCSHSTIHYIEKNALKKMRREFERLEAIPP